MPKKVTDDFSDIFFELAVGVQTQLPICSIDEIVFSGRSNVGKSSLINKIANRKSIARTSSTPGKTGTINFYRSKNFRLVDLPGYGYSKVSHQEKKRWAYLLEHYFNSQRKIKLVIQIIDVRHPPTKQDISMIEFLFKNSFNFIVVATKTDKLSRNAVGERISKLKIELPNFSKIKCIPFSAITREGLDSIKEAVNFDEN